MPIGGAAAFAGDVAADSSNALRYMDRQREQAAREREAADRKRRAELENAARAGLPTIHPFEDFDVAGTPRSRPGRRHDPAQRARPGLAPSICTSAWAEPPSGKRPPGAVRVITRRLELPAATTDFQLSDIVLADAVRRLEDGYPAGQQNAHPYAIGALEATPARDDAFRVDERLSVVFQVINPGARETGKPDVEVGFRVVRLVGEREVVVGNLPPQRYTARDAAGGLRRRQGPSALRRRPGAAHPVRARPLSPDRHRHRSGRRPPDVARRAVRGHRHAAEPAERSAGARTGVPPRRRARRRRWSRRSPGASARRPRRRRWPACSTPRPTAASPNWSATSRWRRPSGPTAQALRGLGLFALGDRRGPWRRSCSRPWRRAPRRRRCWSCSAPPTRWAATTRRRSPPGTRPATPAWTTPASPRCWSTPTCGRATWPAPRRWPGPRSMRSRPNAAAARGLAATRIAAGQYAEALAGLDALTSARRADPDTDFLVIHALYGGFVGETRRDPRRRARERLQAVGERYVAAGGRACRAGHGMAGGRGRAQRAAAALSRGRQRFLVGGGVGRGGSGPGRLERVAAARRRR